jgi:5-methylthioadenosine/S-adenosylhomocysteine deaminase
MPLLIQGGLVVTMNAGREMLEGGFVLVDDGGSIMEVGPASRTPPAAGAEVIDATGMVVLPGLIDACQVHSQNLLMGTRPPGGEPPVWEQRRFASQHIDAAALADAARVTAATLLRGGTTCLLNLMPNALAGPVDATVDALFRTGIRQVQALPFVAGEDPAFQQEHLQRLLHSLPRPGREGMVHGALEVSVSVCANRSGQVSEAALATAYRLAREEDVRVVARTASAEGASAQDWHQAMQVLGRSEVMHLMELGLLDARWLLIGAETLRPVDLSLVRESGCAMVCTPMALANRGLQPGPWPELLRAGVRCALGSDPSARSPMTDMLEQMKSCVLVNNASRLDATAMSSESVLEMATIHAARALGIDHLVGSLEPGKRADIAVFDLRGVHTQVAHKPISLLVTSAGATDAAWVLVDGRVVLRDGRLCAAAEAGGALERCLARARRLGPLWHAHCASDAKAPPALEIQ